LRDQPVDLTVEVGRGIAQGRPPDGPLLGLGRLGNIKGEQRSLLGAAPLPAGDDQQPQTGLNQAGDGALPAVVRPFHGIAIQQQGAVAQDCFPLPQAQQPDQLARLGGDDRGRQQVQVQTQVGASGSGQGTLALDLRAAQLRHRQFGLAGGPGPGSGYLFGHGLMGRCPL